MASKGSCKRVWLCATEDPTDICYRHYHNCYRGAEHPGECESTSGPGHHSGNRTGHIVASVPDAYRQMRDLGWK